MWLDFGLLCVNTFPPVHLLCPFLLLSSTSKQQKTQKAAKISEISDPILLDRYIAIADYNKVKKNECSLTAGQTVEVIDKNQNGERQQFTRVYYALYFSKLQCTTVHHSILHTVLLCIHVDSTVTHLSHSQAGGL